MPETGQTDIIDAPGCWHKQPSVSLISAWVACSTRVTSSSWPAETSDKAGKDYCKGRDDACAHDEVLYTSSTASTTSMQVAA